MAEKYGRERTAPFHSIPSRRIVSVEHPGIIKNVDRAIATLYGNRGVTKILNPPKPDTPANLTLRPEDALSKPLQSISSMTNNILLRVTVPKRTGRKRKRGSDEPFTACNLSSGGAEPERRDAKSRLRILRDNVGKYTVEPVGRVDRTHVFRGIPDIVYSTASSPFTQKFREHILPYDFEKMKGFDLDMTRGEIRNVDLIPPTAFSHGDVPFQYTYRQSPTVRQSVDAHGKITTVNTQQANKVLTHLVSYDIPVVPSKPRENCPPIPTLDKLLQETIATLEDLFTERVAWTRRALRNFLKTPEQRYLLRHAIAYVGYIFRSGPWRDVIVKFGHDPRSSPEYRKYQTFMFQFLPREPELARDGGRGWRSTLPQSEDAVNETLSKEGRATSHLFTGQPPLSLDGKIWMVCDIIDPLIRRILFPENPPPNFIRSECDWLTDGWFGNGTVAKVRTIIRVKIQSLIKQNRAVDDSEFDSIISFPDHAPSEQDLARFHLDCEKATSREMAMATEVRATIKGAPGWRTGPGAGRNQSRTTISDGTATPEDIAANGDDDAADEEAARRLMEEEDSDGEEEAIEREEIAEMAAAVAQSQADSKLERETDDNDEDEGDEDDAEQEDEELNDDDVDDLNNDDNNEDAEGEDDDEGGW